ncbi:MAG: DUF1489 domain-containing protein [Alphaproteobacteria bacterium]|nr:DUF1489 domain-containing protein [Alphaproteobacteria bacterium]
MALHLIKLAVGIESVSHLRERQRQRLAEAAGHGQDPRLRILTRNMPRRGDEIVGEGGSLYWVIKGHILVRQAITAIEPVTNAESNRRCAIYLDPELVGIRSRRSRPFQGWRYLEADRAPPDSAGGLGDENEAPPEMAADLRDMGLL